MKNGIRPFGDGDKTPDRFWYDVMTLSGNLSLTPTEHPPKEEKEPVVVPTIKIAASTAPCVEAAPKVTVQGADTKKAETKK